MQVKNKVAVVTGAASGLGKQMATALVAAGSRVLLTDINAAAGQAAAAALGPANALFVAADICSETSLAAAVTAATEHFGGLHMSVHCAGVAPAQKMLNREGQPKPLAHFQEVLNINLLGSYNLARLAAAAMLHNGPEPGSGERGVIINTASVAAFEGQIGQCAYAASKAGVVGLTLPMAREMAAHGVRVNCIAPGVMATPMMQAMPEKVQQSVGSAVPFPQRMGLPEEFAALALHIIENSYINGETIRLDGAIRMGAS